MHWKPNPDLYPLYLRSRIRRGRGTGEGLDYLPWLKTRDVPSIGTSCMPPGILVRRPYHFLSELESIYFFLVERKNTTVDIREQWPILDLDRTIELCMQSGVPHISRKHYPEPFTIDFLITENVEGKLSYRAASIKTPEDALDPKVRLRLSIEHAWCREQGIPWTLIDTSKFDKTMLATLRFMRGWFSNRYEPDMSNARLFSEQFNALYKPNILLCELIQRTAKTLNLSELEAQNSFRYCAWKNEIEVSLFHQLSLDRPLSLC